MTIPAAEIDGIVLDPRGNPVAGATVLVRGTSDGFVDHETTSAADGTWRVLAGAGTYEVSARTLEHGRTRSRVVRSDGHAPKRGMYLPFDAPQPRDADADVDPARCISGVVVDHAGRPVLGARVVATVPAPPWETILRCAHAEPTDALGRFRLARLSRPESEYELTAEWPRAHARLARSAAPPAPRARIGDADVRLVLAPGASISGRVLHAGRPVRRFAIAWVSANRRLRDSRIQIESPIEIDQPDGRFTLPHFAPGTFRVVVLSLGLRRAVLEDVAVADGEALELGDIALAAGRRIRGYVRDRDGAPVAGASVILGPGGRLGIAGQSAYDRWFAPPDAETMTDAHGAYVLDGLDLDMHHPHRGRVRLCATHDDRGVSLLHAVPDAEADAELDFVVHVAGRITGSVANARGGQTWVHAQHADEPADARSTPVEADGSFCFDAVPPGDYTVRLSPPATTTPTVHVVPNATSQATLEVAVPAVLLTLTIPRGRGRDFVIEPAGDSAHVGHGTRLGSADSWRIEHVRPGRYRVSLDGQTWTAIDVDAEPAEQTIDLCARRFK